MPYIKNLIEPGQQFGRLVALRIAEKRGPKGQSFWVCRCSCGSDDVVIGRVALTSGKTCSCGCLRAESNRRRQRTHGRAGTKEFGIWCKMRARCENARDDAFVNYGGRGIKVCPEWADFAQFFADMGECPAGMSLDRVDNNGPYSKANCRWATRLEQAANRRNNIMLEWNGEMIPLRRLALMHGIKPRTAHQRYHSGWSLERIIEQVNSCR